MAEDLRQGGPGELMLMNWTDDRAGRVLMEVGAADAATFGLTTICFGSGLDGAATSSTRISRLP